MAYAVSFDRFGIINLRFLHMTKKFRLSFCSFLVTIGRRKQKEATDGRHLGESRAEEAASVGRAGLSNSDSSSLIGGLTAFTIAATQ